MDTNGKMTIIVIAKEAGVSIATVSRVINGSCRISRTLIFLLCSPNLKKRLSRPVTLCCCAILLFPPTRRAP